MKDHQRRIGQLATEEEAAPPAHQRGKTRSWMRDGTRGSGATGVAG